MRRLGVTCLVAMALTACGGDGSPGDSSDVSSSRPPPAETTASETSTAVSLMQVSGTLTIPGGLILDSDSRLCVGMNEYEDLDFQTQVVVSDASGTTLGVGELEWSEVLGEGPTRECRFHFEIRGIPRGEGFYGLEIGDRGVRQFAENDIGGPLDLTLD